MIAVDVEKTEIEVRAVIVDGQSLLYIWIKDGEGNKSRVKFTGNMAEHVAEAIYRELKKFL